VAGALDGWLREAEASALAPFAAGLRRDEDAVRAALTEAWSNGPVEGRVNRLMIFPRSGGHLNKLGMVRAEVRDGEQSTGIHG
jgi:transposase